MNSLDLIANELTTLSDSEQGNINGGYVSFSFEECGVADKPIELNFYQCHCNKGDRNL